MELRLSSEPSVHDNYVYAYSLRCDERRLILHTAFRDCEPGEFTDIVFSNLVAHHFEDVLEVNILFDVEECDLGTLINDNAGIFTNSWRYGWPPVEYRGDLAVLIQMLKSTDVRAYVISSSLGLSGWVLAGGCQRVSRVDKSSEPT